MKKIFLWPDTHAPYHDRKAVNIALKAAHNFKPDILLHGGDLADFYCISGYLKNPARRKSLQWELRHCNSLLNDIDSLGIKRKIFLCGNHSDRLGKYLSRQAPELYSMMRIPDLFCLKDRGWEYYPYQKPVRIGKVDYVHDIGYSGQNALRQTLGDMQGNTVTFHTHRMGYIVEGNMRGDRHISFSPGWLGDIHQVDYLPTPKVKRDWTTGFGYGYIEPSGITYLFPAPIIRGKVMVNGKIIK